MKHPLSKSRGKIPCTVITILSTINHLHRVNSSNPYIYITHPRIDILTVLESRKLTNKSRGQNRLSIVPR